MCEKEGSPCGAEEFRSHAEGGKGRRRFRVSAGAAAAAAHGHQHSLLLVAAARPPHRRLSCHWAASA
eukprot:13063902-Alexandrium_andersonii.AAC.1